eukprot:SAG31_NODE_14208_length_820_cov_5.550624_1_plen_114_part_00
MRFDSGAAAGGPGHLGGDLRGVYIEVPTNEVQRASELERSSPGAGIMMQLEIFFKIDFVVPSLTKFKPPGVGVYAPGRAGGARGRGARGARGAIYLLLANLIRLLKDKDKEEG